MIRSRYEIRPIELGDVESLLATYVRVFGRKVTRTEWEWAFHDNPAGTRCFVAVQAGQVVAQYAAWPQRVWIDGTERTFCQVVDSMVHPEHRAGLKRPGLFVKVGEAFFEAYGGGDVDWVFFGWPVDENWRIGERFLGYERVGPQVALVRSLSGLEQMAQHALAVASVDQFDRQAREVYERCVGDFGASAIRDAVYLNWRYVQRPGRDYVRLGVRDDQSILRGLAIASPMRLGGEELWCIADWLVPPHETDAAEALIGALATAGLCRGATGLVLWMPSWSPWFEWFKERGFRMRPTPYHLVARSFTPSIDAAFMRERWWYQMGDSDLV